VSAVRVCAVSIMEPKDEHLGQVAAELTLDDVELLGEQARWPERPTRPLEPAQGPDAAHGAVRAEQIAGHGVVVPTRSAQEGESPRGPTKAPRSPSAGNAY
jgi:hypothetical protein